MYIIRKRNLELENKDLDVNIYYLEKKDFLIVFNQYNSTS